MGTPRIKLDGHPAPKVPHVVELLIDRHAASGTCGLQTNLNNHVILPVEDVAVHCCFPSEAAALGQFGDTRSLGWDHPPWDRNSIKAKALGWVMGGGPSGAAGRLPFVCRPSPPGYSDSPAARRALAWSKYS